MNWTLNLCDEIQIIVNNTKLSNREIHLTLEPHIVVIANQDLLQILIRNLLENAVKYSNSQIFVDVSVLKNEAVFSITNDGDLIPPEQLEKIYNSYFREEEYEFSNISGFGLGLAIVARICHIHKWRIHTESDIEVGNKFTVTFPLAPAQNFLSDEIG